MRITVGMRRSALFDASAVRPIQIKVGYGPGMVFSARFFISAIVMSTTSIGLYVFDRAANQFLGSLEFLCNPSKICA